MQLIITFTFFLVYSVNCAKILGVFPAVSYSHFNVGVTLLKELAARGHNVTLISPFPQKPPVKNLRDIELTGFIETSEKMAKDVNMFDMFSMSPILVAFMLGQFGFIISNMTLQHENVQKLLNSNETFDAVINEQFINEALHGLAYHFKAPSILLSTVGSTMWTNELVGNSAPPSYIPDVSLKYSPRMTFFERVFNSFYAVFHRLIHHFYYYPGQNKILHKYLPDAPHLYDIIYNTSLVLLNSHVSYSQPVPHVPNMIEIGGFHVKKPKKLPDDLQKFLDGAKDGAIYFSMGSNLKSKALPVQKRDAILKVISQLKTKVLWKWEDDQIPNQPPNLKIGKWLPQPDILAHPNIKAFITHGGLLSTIETIYHGVPVVGIPVFGDQKMNMANAVNNGYGILVPYESLSERSLGTAVNEILTNPKYSENAKMRSKIMHDQPDKPMDRAVYWVEYVIRNKGAAHFRSASLDLTWYQYASLDVILFLTVITIIVFFIFYIIIKKILGKRKKSKVKSKKL